MGYGNACPSNLTKIWVPAGLFVRQQKCNGCSNIAPTFYVYIKYINKVYINSLNTCNVVNKTLCTDRLDWVSKQGCKLTLFFILLYMFIKLNII